MAKTTAQGAWIALVTLVAAAFLAACPAPPAGAQQAQEPSLTVAKEDRPLEIEGLMGNDPASFSRSVTLTAKGGDASEVLLTVEKDLVYETETGKDVRIDPSDVAIPSGIALDDGEPRDVRVTVSGIQRPGTYKGTISFRVRAEEQTLTRRTDPLKVIVKAFPEPKVAPLSTAGSAFQLVRSPSSDILEGANRLLGWTLPEGLTDDKKVVAFTNRTTGDVKVTGTELIMQGQKAGRPLTPDAYEILPVNRFPERASADGASEVVVKFARQGVEPDRYAGVLEVDLERAKDPVVANITLDVRDPPLFPFLLILLGVLFGRAAAGAFSPTAQMHDLIRGRIGVLEDRIGRLKLEEKDEKYLLDGLNSARERIRVGTDTQEALTKRLDKVEADIDFLGRLGELHSEAGRLGVDDKVEDPLKKARAALYAGDADEANKARQEAEKVVADSIVNGPSKNKGEALEAARQAYEATPARALPRVGNGAPVSGTGDSKGTLRRVRGGIKWLVAGFLKLFAGAPAVDTESRWWFVRPTLFVLLLGLLAVLGWQTLYVTNGANFGVGGPLEYFGLFLWGLSSDIVGRTLLSLPR